MTRGNVTNEDFVRCCYRILLQREPDEAGFSHFVALMGQGLTVEDVAQSFLTSAEYKALTGSARQPDPANWLYCYNSCFDPQELIQRFAVPDLRSEPGFLTNFLGTKIRPSLFSKLLEGREGTLEGIPSPGNFHADIAEWGSALRAVDQATGVFRIVELGCGWGCWMSNLGTAARRRGLQVDLMGVEADTHHISMARQILADNQFSLPDYRIFYGAAGRKGQTALFPIVANSEEDWGSYPIFYPTADQINEAKASGKYSILSTYSLEDIVTAKTIDLLHIDIQGGETDFVHANIQSMSRLVRRVLVGTHSRVIEGDLMRTMMEAGWMLELERPAYINLIDGHPVLVMDGVHLYKNPAL